MDIYKLYRNFWDFCFENPEKIKPNDIAIFSFAVEHCNRLGWKKKFGFPTSIVMEATGIKSYSVYKKHLDNLISCGLILIIEYSKNQYSSNIIALEENYKANNKALDKARVKHLIKQDESTCESIVSINKQLTNKPETQIDTISENQFIDIWKRARIYYDKKQTNIDKLLPTEKMLFKQLLNEGHKKQDFEFAVAGLFFQKTVPAVRVRPVWLLKPENFFKMLDCWKNKSKIYIDDNDKSQSSKPKFQKGDI